LKLGENFNYEILQEEGKLINSKKRRQDEDKP